MRDFVFLAGLLFGCCSNFLAQHNVQEKNPYDLVSLIGQEQYRQLQVRLTNLNRDIATRGLHDYPGADGKLITGYAYGEFFDWDLYFENLYLSYYGISDYDFTNLKLFLDKQQPDGFVARTLGIKYPRPTQMFKPFMAQLVVLGASQNGNDYEWLRANYYHRLQKYIDRWFAYDHDGNGLPVWNSSDASGMDNQLSGPAILSRIAMKASISPATFTGNFRRCRSSQRSWAKLKTAKCTPITPRCLPRRLTRYFGTSRTGSTTIAMKRRARQSRSNL